MTVFFNLWKIICISSRFSCVKLNFSPCLNLSLLLYLPMSSPVSQIIRDSCYFFSVTLIVLLKHNNFLCLKKQTTKFSLLTVLKFYNVCALLIFCHHFMYRVSMFAHLFAPKVLTFSLFFYWFLSFSFFSVDYIFPLHYTILIIIIFL